MTYIINCYFPHFEGSTYFRTRHLDNDATHQKGYYRLKMLDFDGTFSYSKIIAVNANEKFTVKVYPNPTQHYLTVDINNPTETELVLFDVLGKVVQRITTTTTASNKIPLQNLAKGMYHIQLFQQNKVVGTYPFVIQ